MPVTKAKCIMCENFSLLRQPNGSWFCCNCGVAYRVDDSCIEYQRYHFFPSGMGTDVIKQEKSSPKELQILLNDRTLQMRGKNGAEEAQ